MTPSINEIVGLLQLKAPQQLEALTAEFSDNADLLKPGIPLGEVSSVVKPKNLLIRARVCLAGLATVLDTCNTSIPALKKRLKNLGVIQLVSQCVVALSGATLLTQNEAAQPYVKVITGVLAITASLLTLYIQHRSGTVANNAQSIFGLYDTLCDFRFEAEALKQEIDIVLQVFDEEAPTAELTATITRANQICFEIRKLLDKI